MNRVTFRPDHIEDWLVKQHTGQWFGWTDHANKIYANLILTSEFGVGGTMVANPHSLPTEQECTDGLAQLQTNFDAKDYARNRQAEYPSIQDLVVALYDEEDKADIIARRNATKLKYPKP